MDGILLIDKPAGLTSAEADRRVRRWLKPARVGHLGTLDPLATGLLPLVVGEATKLAPFLADAEKEYEGVIRLGVETDTLDSAGRVVREAPVPALDTVLLAELAARFSGTIEQTPPVYSAIKRAGVPLYKLARRGAPVAPPSPRLVEVRNLELEPGDADEVRFRMVCSAGTYLRAFARDIGVALGSAAHLAKLRRLRSGGLSVEQAKALSDVLAELEGGGRVELLGMREALSHLAEAQVEERLGCRLRNGDFSALDGRVPAGALLFKVVCGESLLAVAEATSNATARLVRVFVG